MKWKNSFYAEFRPRKYENFMLCYDFISLGRSNGCLKGLIYRRVDVVSEETLLKIQQHLPRVATFVVSHLLHVRHSSDRKRESVARATVSPLER